MSDRAETMPDGGEAMPGGGEAMPDRREAMRGRAGHRGADVAARLYAVKRWMYRTGRPGRLARGMNRVAAAQYAAGLFSSHRGVTLEVRGRRSGRVVSVPVVVADHDGREYLVSMLGNDANWVRNVRAAGGHAVLRRGRPAPVLLEEVSVGERAPILRRYLAVAPGARPHVPVDRHAPLEAFEEIAASHPVFRITRASAAAPQAAPPE